MLFKFRIKFDSSEVSNLYSHKEVILETSSFSISLQNSFFGEKVDANAQIASVGRGPLADEKFGFS